MKKLSAFLLCILLMSMAAQASITNFVFDHSKVYGPDDSLIYSFSSDYDSAWSDIYIDAGSPTGLDTSIDKLLYPILQLDNNVEEVKSENPPFVLPDADPLTGKYRFAPGSTDLPAGLYWIMLFDHDNVIVDSFRVKSVGTPYRTISGTITPPSGERKDFIQVNAEPEQGGGNSRISAFTDANGDYIMLIDSTSVVAVSGKFIVRLENNFENYLVEPSEQRVDVASDNIAGIDFSFIQITSGVRGIISSNGVPLSNVNLGLQDSISNQNIGWTNTDNNGAYSIGCQPGVYRLDFSSDYLSPNYMSPQISHVVVSPNQFTVLDVEVPLADTVIIGRITKDNGAPGDDFMVELHSQSGENLSSQAPCDLNGYFRLPAVKTDSIYWINVNTWDSRYAKVPDGYQFEFQQNSKEARLGDTVYFNMVSVPSGAITGTVNNSSGIAFTRMHFMLYKADSSNQNQPIYDFDRPFNGTYMLTGIENGSYNISAMLGTGSNPTMWKLQKTLRNTNGSLMIFVVNNNAVQADFTFTLSDTMGAIQPQGTIVKGKVTSSVPPLPPDLAIVNISSTDGKGYYNSIQVTPNGDYTFYDVPFGNYRISASIDTNSDMVPEAVSNEIEFKIDNSMDYEVDLSLREKITGNSYIEGVVSYPGTLPMDKGMVLLMEQKSGDVAGVTMLDQDGKYSFDHVPPSDYKVLAMLDTNSDFIAEAFGEYGIILSIGLLDTLRNIDFSIMDKPIGTGSISGTLTSQKPLPPESKITIYALPVDTTLPDSELVSGESAGINSYSVTVDGLGDYSVRGLPDTNYVLVAMVNGKDPMDTSNSIEIGVGVYGTKLPNSDPGNWDFNFVSVKEGAAVTGINVEIQLDTVSPDAVEQPKENLPTEFALGDPAPNPFNPEVHLSYSIPQKALVSIVIYDISGKLVRKLVNREMEPGYLRTAWDSRNEVGVSMASGVYVCRMQAGKFVANRKLILMK